MFKACLAQGGLLKRMLEAIKELVSDANFDCSETGIALQAMDNSHVALVSLLLKAEAFDPYICARGFSLGVNLNSLNKILRCAGNDDTITLQAEDESADSLTLVFDSPNQERISEYELKLMDIDQENLHIPDTDYDAKVHMSSAEFQRITRDLSTVSEAVTISVTKEGIRFVASGEVGSGSITLKKGSSVDSNISTTIELSQPVSLDFSLKYLANFAKAAPLSDVVSLSISENLPLLVEYEMESVGFIRYYLAPKINEE
ncbi:5980_t:CDS:2 [Paraglomus occultum]|uniref:DNA sliding clamp PCNA n=1 Tax=Paraglomus occultum TaxID=144539 RepID=A0A9N9GCJ3_9GLOM|nr:5980_t:CDS:2 [Paraglomus occultum]